MSGYWALRRRIADALDAEIGDDPVALRRMLMDALASVEEIRLATVEEIRPVTFEDRLAVAEIAGDALDHFPNDPKLYRLIDAVRCCGEFPECSHVLAWVEERDARVSPGGGTKQ